MKTSKLNKNESFIANRIKILPDTGIPLQTFHHLLYDSLMPWLPENDDSLRYQFLMSDLMENKHPFFQAILEIYRNRNIIPAPLLEEEWKLFSHIPSHQRALDVFKSREAQMVSTAKIFFYYQLIFYALLYSESLFVLLMDEATDTIRRYLTSQWLKIIRDLRQRIDKTYKTSLPDNATILYLTDIALTMLEIEIQQNYISYCQPVLVLQSSGKLKPRADSLERDKAVISATDNWFKTIYLSRFILHNETRKPLAPLSSVPGETNRIIEALKKDPSGLSVSRPPQTRADLSAKKAAGTDPEEIIIGSGEVQKLLGIGKTKLLELCKNDLIPHYRMGRRYKFEKSKILAFRKQLINNNDEFNRTK